MTDRKPWECIRCHKINAPHVDSCDCQPPAAIGVSVTPPVIKPPDGAAASPNDTWVWRPDPNAPYIPPMYPSTTISYPGAGDTDTASVLTQTFNH